MWIRKFKEKDTGAHSKSTQTTYEQSGVLNNFSKEMTSMLTHGNRGLGAWTVFTPLGISEKSSVASWGIRGAVVKEVKGHKTS